MSKSSWLDRLGKAAEAAQLKPIAELSPPRPAPKAQPVKVKRPKTKPVVHMASFQIRPSSDDDPGAIELVYYSIDDGLLRIHDETGERTVHEHHLAPGEDAKRAAVRLARAAWLEERAANGPPNFNRSLRLRPTGIA
jgi:hypothetical protein